MYDPNEGKLNIEAAEEALGIDDDAQILLRLDVAVELCMAKLEILPADVQRAYEAKVGELLKQTRDSLDSLVVGGLDAIRTE